MTSSELVDRISGYRPLAQSRTLIAPGDVYQAANDTQDQLLSELRILEDKTPLVLVSGRSEYQYPAVSVSNATNVSPIVVTAASHGFNTGDKVVVSGVLGNTAANGTFTITKVDSNSFSLDGSTGNGAYASGGTCYHRLFSALDVRYIRKTASPYGYLNRRAFEYMDRVRGNFDSSVAAAYVVDYTIVETDPLTIIVGGVPNETVNLEVLFYRKALPSEAISGSVNPIVPSQYGHALYLGTLLHFLSTLPDAGALQQSQVIAAQYETEKARIRQTLARKKMKVEPGPRFFGFEF